MMPVQAIPADLDVVVRIDLEPIRAALPAQAQSDLAAVALAGDFSAASDVVRRALDRAQQVWVGFRPGQLPEHTDNVLVLRGDFSKIPLAELGDAFKPARDLGGGWSAYDARRVRGRSAPARLYTHLDDLWVVASEAELDAVERVLEEGVRERRLEPPERGVLSVAARMAGVAASIRQSSPKAARFLSQADVGTMSADLSSEGLEVFAELGFVDEATAARSARALQLVLGALAASNPDGFQAHTEINTVGSAVTLRAKVPHSLLSSFLPHAAAPENP
jgi:Arc/MetJ-type ribon-helix-helix transcriptional regulator